MDQNMEREAETWFEKWLIGIVMSACHAIALPTGSTTLLKMSAYLRHVLQGSQSKSGYSSMFLMIPDAQPPGESSQLGTLNPKTLTLNPKPS